MDYCSHSFSIFITKKASDITHESIYGGHKKSVERQILLFSSKIVR